MSDNLPSKGSTKHTVTPYRKARAARHAKFLKELGKTGNISHSARVAGLSRKQVYTHQQTNRRFKARVEEQLTHFADSLEHEAVRRGRDGYHEEVYSEGALVGFKTRYSDRLLMATLAAHKRELYGKQVVQVEGSNGGPVQMASLNVNANVDLSQITQDNKELSIFSAPGVHSVEE